MLRPDFETSILNSGKYSKVVGLDEVGRGCLAGPVTVGAFAYTSDTPFLEKVDDSKVVSAKQRAILETSLTMTTHTVRFAAHHVIDEIGIARAIEQLMQDIIDEWRDGQTLFLIDGKFAHDFGPDVEVVIDGDASYYSIAAASIIAKVKRDAHMCTADTIYPEYSFAQHKGYGTKQHLTALQQYGPCEIHRRSFSPVSQFVYV